MVRRCDASTIRAKALLPGGALQLDAYLTRVGVFVYRLADGSVRRELRHPDEVFSAESLASLAHAPLTDLHPDQPVDPDTWAESAVGHVAPDVRPEGVYVAASVVVPHGPTLRQLDTGERKELSCGYTADLEMTAGIWEGEAFDAIQRNIRYNHVALGPPGWGRAGPNVAVRTDSQDGILEEREQGKRMAKITIDSAQHEVPDAVASHLDKLQGRADATDKALAQVKADLAKAQDPKAIQDRVKARMDLVKTAHKVAKLKGVTFDEAKAADVPDSDFEVAIIKMIDPTFDPAGKTPDYIKGAFQIVVKGLVEAAGSSLAPTETPPVDGQQPPNQPPAPPAPGPYDSIFAARGDAPPPKGKEAPAPVSAVKARADMLDANRSAHTGKLAFSKD